MSVPIETVITCIQTNPVAGFIAYGGGPSDTMLRQLPEHMHAGLVRYIVAGVKPGSFLLAVLSQEPELAARRADMHNVSIIHKYFEFLAAECPPEAWGSPNKIQAWIARGGLVGKD